jgi:hypothetical protein
VVIFQKLINEIKVNFMGHRISLAVGVFTLLLYDRLHKASYTLIWKIQSPWVTKKGSHKLHK